MSTPTPTEPDGPDAAHARLYGPRPQPSPDETGPAAAHARLFPNPKDAR